MATTYFWSNRSDHGFMNGIARGPRSAVSYFQTERDNVITYTGRNLLLNSINRGLAISLYRKKGRFYRPNYCTINHTILSSTFNSYNSKPVHICQVLRNPASCDIAKLQWTYYFQIKISIRYWYVHVEILRLFVVFKNNVLVCSSNYSYYPSGPDLKYPLLSIFRNMLIPKSNFGGIQAIEVRSKKICTR